MHCYYDTDSRVITIHELKDLIQRFLIIMIHEYVLWTYPCHL